METFKKILFCLVFVFLPIQLMAEGKKVALVIGNANYNEDSGFKPLSNPLNDARAIADKLSSLGFTISGNKPLLDGTKRQMSAAIEQFMYDSRDADVVLFYYSGHGASRDNKEALLLPLGETFKEFNFRESCIGLETVVSAMNRYDNNRKNKFKIIILDACRNAPYSNPLDKSKGAFDVNKGLVRTTPPDGFAFCYATAPGETAIERANERYSVYTEALLAELSSGKNFSNMMAAVSKRVKDKTNNRQAPKFESEFTGDFLFVSNITKPQISNELALVSTNYLQDSKSQITTTNSQNSEDLFNFKDESGKWGFRNGHSDVVIPCIFETAFYFEEDRAAVKLDGLWGYIDPSGNMVIQPEYYKAYNFSEGLAFVCKKNSKGFLRYGFIDKSGRIAIPLIYCGADGPFKYGLACVEPVDAKYGNKIFIDKYGNNVFGKIFQNAKGFSDGLAAVQINGKWGFIDTKGNIVIQCKYDDGAYFTNGTAWLIYNGKKVTINKSGEIISNSWVG